MKRIQTVLLLLAVLALSSRTACAWPPMQDQQNSLPSLNRKLLKTQGSTKHDTIRCGVLDKAGRLWFGTTGEGVYRYENESFTQYSVQDGLASNTVWCIMEDKSGAIWFGTDSGLSRWDGTGIRPVPFSSSGDGLSKSAVSFLTLTDSAPPAVWSLLEDKSGTIWIGTEAGMFCGKDDLFTPFLGHSIVKNVDRLHLRMIEDICEDQHGNIWFASGMPPGMEGLCRFDGTTLTRFNPGGQKWIRTVLEDRNGVLWLGTRTDGVWFYDGKTFSPFRQHTGLRSPHLVDRTGNIWFSGKGRSDGLQDETGVWRYDGKSFQNFSTTDGLANLEVWCIVEDGDSNIWVGTRNTGLYRYDGKSFVCFSE
jgi:ligand-binding sensor domain-containing protein